MLEELPETLDETYERILRDINKANRAHAHRLLQCLTVAVRPLRVAELAEVLAVDFGTAACGRTSKLNTDWRWEDQQHAVLFTCSSLISVVDEDGSQVVQFSHFSVKEFLTSPRLASSSADVSRFHILLQPAHTILGWACLSVLLRLDEHVDGYNVEDSFPLARYAAEHWVNHARFENVSSHIREEMEYLFDPDKPYFAVWLQVYDIDTKPPYSSPFFHFTVDESNTATPLYYAALCGFCDLAEHLIIKHSQQVNANGGYYVSPLVAALGREHLGVAQLLYEHGADVDVQGFNRRTLLNALPCKGRLEVVEWLLGHGANPNLRSDLNLYTPLHVAALNGHVEVSRKLLQHKVDQNALDKNGRTPLRLAAEGGHIDVARLLLEHGVDVNALDDKRSTSLHLASKGGHINVARLLLEHGIDAAALDSKRSTALHLASKGGHINVAQLLLKHGVEVNAQDNRGRTPLHIAALRGEAEVSQILLQHKADQNALDSDGQTPLHLASKGGYIKVARVLLEHGVDANALDNNRSTALHLASEENELEVACLLLEHGADVEAEDNSGRTPLQVASGEQCDEIIKLLSERHILKSTNT
jgi:ankyrin repeat protein